jgi:predicted membrane protein
MFIFNFEAILILRYLIFLIIFISLNFIPEIIFILNLYILQITCRNRRETQENPVVQSEQNIFEEVECCEFFLHFFILSNNYLSFQSV